MAIADTDILREKLRIAVYCSDCPRYKGGSGSDSCKGHLQWGCNAVWEAEQMTEQRTASNGC